MATLDAVAWPALFMAAAFTAWPRGGILVPVIAVGALLNAPMRLCRAIFRNERYRFTTWRWGRAIGALILGGALMKLAILMA